MSAPYLGDFSEDQEVVFYWNTNDGDGASITRATDGTIKVRRDDGTDCTGSSVTDNEDTPDTGIHECKIDTTDSANFAVGYDYTVWLDGAVIDGQTVNAALACFSIENRFQEVDVVKWAGTAIASVISAANLALLEDILDGTGGTGLTLNKLRINASDADGAIDVDNDNGAAINAMGSDYGAYLNGTGGAGLLAYSSSGVGGQFVGDSGEGLTVAGSTSGVVFTGSNGDGIQANGGTNGHGMNLTGAGSGYDLNANIHGTLDTVTTCTTTTTNTDMRGTDNAALAAKLEAYVQLICRSDAAIATDRSTELGEINADEGSGAGNFSNQTDSVEGIRDQGDSAWITATSVAVSDKTGFKLASDGLDAVTAWTVNITGSLSGSVGSVTGAVGSVTGAVGSVTGAVGSVAGNVDGNVTGSVGSVVGAVGSVTGAVGSVTGAVGSVAGNVDGSVASVVGAVGSVAGNVDGNVSGSVGSVVGAVGSVTGAVGSVAGNVDGNVSGSVGSVAGNVDGNVSGSVGSVIGAVGSVTGAVGSVTGDIGGNVNGNVSGSVGSVTGSVGSVTGAVGSVTGGVGGNIAGDVQGKVLGGGAGVIAGDGVQASSVTGAVGSVTGAVGSVAGAVGSVTGNVGGDVSGKVIGGGAGVIAGDGVRAESVTGAVGSVTGAVGSVTGSVGSVTAAVTIDAPSKTGHTLAATGLDTIPVTEPAGVAGTFREMVVQTWRRFFKKSTLTSTQLKTYKDDDSVATTQTAVDAAGTQTLEDAT